MNWIIKFNQLEKENVNKVLDIVAKFDKYKNDKFDDIYTKAYSLKYPIDNLIDKLNAHAIVGEKLKQEVERLFAEYIQMKDQYESALDDIYKYLYDCGSEAAEIQRSMIRIISRYLTSHKDAFLFEKRMDVFTKTLINMAFIFDMGGIGSAEETEVLKEVCKDLMTIKDIINTRNKEYDDKQNEMLQKLRESQKRDYLKIYDYKEMIDLAKEHGYKQIRQSGDHIIMQHNKTNKILPIPAHELKYGLMLQIQKQIKVNKVS